MKHIIMSIFLFYTGFCFANKLGTAVKIAKNKKELVSYANLQKRPSFKQMVIVQYKNSFVWGEVIALYGKNCWVGVRKLNQKLNMNGLIKRYLITQVYKLSR